MVKLDNLLNSEEKEYIKNRCGEFFVEAYKMQRMEDVVMVLKQKNNGKVLL